MEKTLEQVEELVHTLHAYVNNRLEGAKLTAIEKASEAAADVTASILSGFVWFLFLIFLGISLAFFMNEVLGNMGWSFMCIAIFYLVLGPIFWRFRSRFFQVPIMNRMIEKMNKGHEEN